MDGNCDGGFAGPVSDTVGEFLVFEWVWQIVRYLSTGIPGTDLYFTVYPQSADGPAADQSRSHARYCFGSQPTSVCFFW